MDKEKTEKMLADFPILYRQYTWDMTRTCMCWGFSHGNGWESIIRDLSTSINAIVETMSPKDTSCETCGSEASGHEEDHEFVPNFPVVVQVKEKFGTLRFYMDHATPEMNAMISKAEAKSAVTCEQCGETGSLRSGGWMRTLCDPCDEAYLERRRNPPKEL